MTHSKFSKLPLFSLIALVLTLSFSAGLACDSEGADELPAVDCNTVTIPSFEEMTVWNTCAGCHSSGLEGDARQGAPADVNFDTYAGANMDPFEAAEQTIEGVMPPSGPLSDADSEQINIWAQCGTPQ